MVPGSILRISGKRLKRRILKEDIKNGIWTIKQNKGLAGKY
jgi:hypothetical protein